MDTRWKTLGPVDANHEYVVLLSYLPLRTYSKIPAFFRYTTQIHRQMRNTVGTIGYSLRAKVLSRRFWTLSVWENGRALMDFVSNRPHGDVIKELRAHMGKTRFTQWKALGSELPPSWDDAMRRELKES